MDFVLSKPVPSILVHRYLFIDICSIDICSINTFSSILALTIPIHRYLFIAFISQKPYINRHEHQHEVVSVSVEIKKLHQRFDGVPMAEIVETGKYLKLASNILKKSGIQYITTHLYFLVDYKSGILSVKTAVLPISDTLII